MSSSASLAEPAPPPAAYGAPVRAAAIVATCHDEAWLDQRVRQRREQPAAHPRRRRALGECVDRHGQLCAEQVEGRRISPRTREAVYRAAEKLGYRPNAAARNLARGKSGVVLYVVPRVAVGEMPMQAGSRMTTELARRGLLQVQIFETEDDQHVIDAVENLDPVAVTSLFPLSRARAEAVEAANVPHIEIGTLPALGDPHLSVGAIRVEHLVSRGHRKIAFAYTGSAKWRALGDYWFEGVVRAARA